MRKRRPLVLRAKRLGLFVTRFGPYHGLRLLRQLDLPSRDTYAVDIPGLSRPVLPRPAARWSPQFEIIRGALWPRPGRARIANPSAQPWAYRVEAGTGDGGEV